MKKIYTSGLMQSMPLCRASVIAVTAAVLPGILYIPITSRPRDSTMLVHLSTINGIYSETDEGGHNSIGTFIVAPSG